MHIDALGAIGYANRGHGRGSYDGIRTVIRVGASKRRTTMETLHDLLTDELKDMFSAETQLTKALPRMAKAATNPELKRAFQDHLKETEEHVRQIERIAADLEIKPRGKKCMGMEGLVEEGKEVI